MPLSDEHNTEKITVLGSLPPLRALSSYCLEFSLAISRLVEIEFISFKNIYPAFLYPGGSLKKDDTFPGHRETSNITERRYITWYNPLSWIMEGLFTKGRLLHAQWWSPPLVFIYLTICLFYKLRRRPVVITVHNILQHEERILFKPLTRILFRLGDHFIVHSAANKEKLISYYHIPGERVTVIPHGPLEFQGGKEMNCDKARHLLGLGQQDRVILVFGAIRPYKGVDIALRAFAKVLQEIPDARLIISGKLWEAWDRYEEIIRKKDLSAFVKKHLHYINADEVAKYFIASDLVILPYRPFEAQSGVGATSVAFRKPMIVTDTGGLPELVLDQANVVPPGDIEALSGRIIYCLSNQPVLKNMTEQADIIAEKISWERAAKKTLSVYERLLMLKG